MIRENAIATPGVGIQLEQVSIRYGNRVALFDVDLNVPRGGITALIGPSGCGKTSLLTSVNRLTDLIPGCVVGGDILISGETICDRSIDLIGLRRRVGMIFQKPNPFPLSIRKNIDLPLREHGIRSREERATILESVLKDTGLYDEVKDRLDAPALALSGGQQQRLCIARALALRPEVLLMDEPCSALDPLSAGVVEDLVATLRGQYTVVIVTHNLAQARRIADEVALFWVPNGSGRLIEWGPTEALFNSPRHPLTAAYIRGHRG